jgi:hypothetical protein
LLSASPPQLAIIPANATQETQTNPRIVASCYQNTTSTKPALLPLALAQT